MLNIDTFRAFCRAVSQGEQPAETRCTAETPKEVLELLDCAAKATPWLAGMGIGAKSSGQGNIQENGFSFRVVNPCSGKVNDWKVQVFTVLPPSARKPTKKGVAASSIEKYHNLDTRGQTMQVAMVAASLTQKHGHTTDSQVAEFVGIPSARVSARRNEIERLQGVVLAGTPHYFETAGRVVCPVTGSSVNGWRVVAAGQTSLFQ